MSKKLKLSSNLTRGDFLKAIGSAGVAAAVAAATPALAAKTSIIKRTIPSTGEKLPIIGLGTSRVFDVDKSAEERAPLKEVLRTLLGGGGTLVDTAPSYGEAETVVGDLVNEMGIRDKVFLATKVRSEGRQDGLEEIAQSFKLLKTKKFELLQIHNLVDWETQLKTLRQMKDKGQVKYIGITHFKQRAYEELSDIIAKEKFDFVQLGYSLDQLGAETRLLKVAADRGTAVMLNRVFGARRGSQFRKIRGEKLPPWAKDFDCTSWGQFFLKYVLSHPAVTCAIPGTSKAKHMRDNLNAGRGRMPDAAQRKQMLKFWDSQ